MIHQDTIATAINAQIANIKANGSQSGEVTHHQDQVATCPMPANLSVKKIKNTSVGSTLAELSLLLFIINFLIYIKIRVSFVETKLNV